MTYYVSSGTLNPTHSLTHSELTKNVKHMKHTKMKETETKLVKKV